MKITSLVLLVFGGLAWLPAAAHADEFGDVSPTREPSLWRWDLSGGFDSYLHTYALATEDTTEAIAEFMFQGGVQGESRRQARNRWRLRAEASAGTELYRQRVEGDYRFRDSARRDRFRLLGRFWGRQYRRDTDYSLSSDNVEGTLEARAYPLVTEAAALELRGFAGILDYRTPSALEVDYRDRGLGAFVRSRGFEGPVWGLGSRFARRAYPDSSAIDRDSWSLEGEFDHHDLEGRGLRVFHKSQRRVIADETVRPSAWTHWTDLGGLVSAGRGQVFLELQNELWSYDEETGAFFDSWRVDGALGYRWGDLLGEVWKLALAAERFDAGDSPETYNQFGLRAGVESYGEALGGMITLEYGRRIYRQGDVVLGTDALFPEGGETLALYTDFDYWKIWLMATWSVARNLDLDILANYEPENHAENTDDAAIGFASVRLAWRP